MKQCQALVVAHDAETVEEITEVLASLEHKYDVAASQQQACGLLRENTYDYVVLDAVIPLGAKGRKPCLDNGWNLLERLSNGADGPPVIVVVGPVIEGGFSPSDVVSMAQAAIFKGAARVVYRPFPPHKRMLDKAIKRVLAGHQGRRQAEAAKSPGAPTAFTGGEMVFYRNRVELCGVKVLGDTGTGQTRHILEELDRVNEEGEFVARGGAWLARAVEAVGGQNAVAGCVRNFRKGVIRALAEKGITCCIHDVIQSGGQGYRLRDWITVRHVGRTVETLAAAQ